MAVAIWDHIPTDDELLEVRLVRGWEPIPTMLVDGPKILGHACKLYVEKNKPTP